MKLDKRACRHAANVPLHISLNAGVLYTERVKYLVTAAVKLLGGIECWQFTFMNVNA